VSRILLPRGRRRKTKPAGVGARARGAGAPGWRPAFEVVAHRAGQLGGGARLPGSMRQRGDPVRSDGAGTMPTSCVASVWSPDSGVTRASPGQRGGQADSDPHGRLRIYSVPPFRAARAARRRGRAAPPSAHSTTFAALAADHARGGAPERLGQDIGQPPSVRQGRNSRSPLAVPRPAGARAVAAGAAARRVAPRPPPGRAQPAPNARRRRGRRPPKAAPAAPPRPVRSAVVAHAGAARVRLPAHPRMVALRGKQVV
jgi:hypothetical protein